MFAVNVMLTVTAAAGIVNVHELPVPLTVTAAPLSFLVTLTVPIEYPVFADIEEIVIVFPVAPEFGTVKLPFVGVVFVMV